MCFARGQKQKVSLWFPLYEHIMQAPPTETEPYSERVKLLVVQRPIEYLVSGQSYSEAVGQPTVSTLTGQLDDSGVLETQNNGRYQIRDVAPSEEQQIPFSTETFLWSEYGDSEFEYVGQVHMIEYM